MALPHQRTIALSPARSYAPPRGGELTISKARVARDHHPDVGILTNDPITGIGERQFKATNAIVAAIPIDVVGVNYYPIRPTPACPRFCLRRGKGMVSRFCRGDQLSQRPCPAAPSAPRVSYGGVAASCAG